jgi:hypothetical protein
MELEFLHGTIDARQRVLAGFIPRWLDVSFAAAGPTGNPCNSCGTSIIDARALMRTRLQVIRVDGFVRFIARRNCLQESSVFPMQTAITNG